MVLVSGQTPDKTVPPKPTAAGIQGIEGRWEGVLVHPAAKLRLVLKVSRGADGSLKAIMDSLDQNANDLPVDSIVFQNGTLHFEMKAIYVFYDATLSKDGSELVGTFNQGVNPLPLILRKGGAARSTATMQRGRIQLKPCNNPTLTSEALCAKYEVYEDRVARTGRKIALNVILLPANSAKPAVDPLFYLAGGPGGAATAYASEKFMDGLRRNRDVVLVDQRGTGDSNPLNCPSPGSKEDMRGYFGEPFPPERIRACRAELEKVANLQLYTTSIAMDDLDEVRGALGFDRINVYGGSYGSTAALVYLRLHPEHVRTVAVFGVAPPDAKLPLSFARSVQDAMNRLFADCAADSPCHGAYPNLESEFKTVLSQFDKGPVQMKVPNVYSGQEQGVTVTRDAFVDGIRQLLYVPNAAAALPALIHLGAQGNPGALVGTAFQVVVQIDRQIARGMQFSVICSEDTPFITEADIKQSSADSFYGDSRTRPTIRACAEWPRATVPANFLDPIKSDAPVLLVSGELDPVTPPWLAEGVVRNLSHSRHIIIHNGTHNSYECVENLVADFVDKGSADGLDTSCIDKIRRPPFTILGYSDVMKTSKSHPRDKL